MKPTEQEIWKYWNGKSLVSVCQWYHEQCMDTKKGPEVGDAVFWRDTNEIYKIHRVIDRETVTFFGADDDNIRVLSIKPATIEQMGKKWDEVPGW